MVNIITIKTKQNDHSGKLIEETVQCDIDLTKDKIVNI